MTTTSTTKSKRELKPLTLLSAIERVADMSNDSKLSAAFFKKGRREISFLSQQYGITDLQAVFFSICLDEGPRRIDYHDIARHVDLNKLRILQYASDIDALVRRRLLCYRDAKDEDSFDVPVQVINALKHNRVYQMPRRTGLDCAAFFEMVNADFDDLWSGAITPGSLAVELQELINQNPQLLISQRLKELCLSA